MRVFLNKPFARFARRVGLSVEDLCDAIGRASAGLIAYGFSKSDQANISSDEMLSRALAAGVLQEINCHD